MAEQLPNAAQAGAQIQGHVPTCTEAQCRRVGALLAARQSQLLTINMKANPMSKSKYGNMPAEEPSANQPLSQNNPAGFALTPSPRPEEQGTLSLEPSRPIPPAPQYQGSMRDRYDIYVANAESLGWPIKSFDEWANS